VYYYRQQSPYATSCPDEQSCSVKHTRCEEGVRTDSTADSDPPDFVNVSGLRVKDQMEFAC